LDAAPLQYAVTNLAMNAVQSMPKGAHVRLTIEADHVQPPADHGGALADDLRVRMVDGLVGDVCTRVEDALARCSSVWPCRRSAPPGRDWGTSEREAP
jgi:hypothetical protein